MSKIDCVKEYLTYCETVLHLAHNTRRRYKANLLSLIPLLGSCSKEDVYKLLSNSAIIQHFESPKDFLDSEEARIKERNLSNVNKVKTRIVRKKNYLKYEIWFDKT